MELLVLLLVLVVVGWLLDLHKPVVGVSEMATREVQSANLKHKIKTIQEFDDLEFDPSKVTSVKDKIKAIQDVQF